MIKPTLQALILAEHVYEDRVTGQKIIAGTFDTVQFSRQEIEIEEEVDEDGEPVHVMSGRAGMNAGSPWLYISLTDVIGEKMIFVRFVDLKHNSVLMETSFPVISEDRLESIELVIPMPYLPTPHEGVYALELLHEEQRLGSLRIHAREIPGEEVKP